MLLSDKIFSVFLIKPSHYDDDGYVIQWLRSAIPSNTLAALNGLLTDCIERRILGDEVRIEVTSYDETNTRIIPQKIIQKINHRGGRGLVALVGVQSNQFPRAVDIARPLRAAGIQVCIGGFHVSGCLAMLPELPNDIQQAQKLGISLFAGEAENRLDEVLLDAHQGKLKPLYNYMADLPGITGTPVPILPPTRVYRTAGGLTSFDAGRGCPFMCSFCTIINVQGRKSRHRSADDIERIIRENAARNIYSFFITDDNLARNQDWENIFDRLIYLREEEGIPIRFIIQVDTLCHKIPDFIDKAARAGVRRVFIGLENINPESLVAAKKKQNRITDYRMMLQAWKNAGVITYAGYILGFPGDTPESIVRDIGIIKRELPIDLLEFFILTPLPGSADHKSLWTKGVWMDPDMNKYDLEHVTFKHDRMSKEDWERAYQLAWKSYYTTEHITTVMKRAVAKGISPGKIMFLMIWFYGCITFENVHPLQGGYLRRKYRKDRRYGLPVENFFLFHARYLWETMVKHIRLLHFTSRLWLVRRKLKRDPKAKDYMDVALSPVNEEELDELEMFNATDAAAAVVSKLKQKKQQRADGQTVTSH